MPFTFRPRRSAYDHVSRERRFTPCAQREGSRRWGQSPRRMAARRQPLVGDGPTYDEAYRRVAREFLRKFSLDGDEEFASTVARRFREAPAKVCCRAIGGWIDRGLLGLGWTQLDLADRIGVDRSAVAKWTAGGAISLGHLVLVLLVLDGDFSDLPLPAARNWRSRVTSRPCRISRRRSSPGAVRMPSIANASGAFTTSSPNPTGNGPSAEGPGPREKGDGPGTQAGERDARHAAPASPAGRGPQATRGRMGGSLGDLPRTPTGGLAVTMKTKLEMMVGYLAGRQGESAESIRRKLRDPAGEASRWLEEVQSRSRDILDGGLLKSRGLDLHPYLRKGIVVQRPAPEAVAHRAPRRLGRDAGIRRACRDVAGAG